MGRQGLVGRHSRSEVGQRQRLRLVNGLSSRAETLHMNLGLNPPKLSTAVSPLATAAHFRNTRAVSPTAGRGSGRYCPRMEAPPVRQRLISAVRQNSLHAFLSFFSPVCFTLFRSDYFTVQSSAVETGQTAAYSAAPPAPPIVCVSKISMQIHNLLTFTESFSFFS